MLDSGIRDLIRVCRGRACISQSCMDIQINISFPEATAQGECLTRPYSRGGPDVFVDISAPAEYKEEFMQFISSLQEEYNVKI